MIERKGFEQSLRSPKIFRGFVRTAAYVLAGGDPERVHEMAIKALNEYVDVIEQVSPEFDSPNLRIEIAGQNVMPFGTAAGLDKNGDALYPLSKIFGFLEAGTVVVNERPGNSRPRIAVDEIREEIYNAQGFPSKGLEYFLGNVRKYRKSGGKAPLLVSICGIPQEPTKLDVAYNELEKLLGEIGPYADGFVWNPFSPNTGALSALRTPKEFKSSAELVARKAGSKLKLVKMGPYDQNYEKENEWLGLVEAWLEGGGDGIVAVNTRMIPKEQVPSRSWGYQSAGRSGPFLQDYRQLAITAARKEFPNAFIVGVGGIDSGDQAFAACEAGANALESYTPYTFHGFGLLLEMAAGLSQSLSKQGYKSLSDFQNHIKGLQ